jgi:hypothetical protein
MACAAPAERLVSDRRVSKEVREELARQVNLDERHDEILCGDREPPAWWRGLRSP